MEGHEQKPKAVGVDGVRRWWGRSLGGFFSAEYFPAGSSIVPSYDMQVGHPFFLFFFDDASLIIIDYRAACTRTAKVGVSIDYYFFKQLDYSQNACTQTNHGNKCHGNRRGRVSIMEALVHDSAGCVLGSHLYLQVLHLLCGVLGATFCFRALLTL